MIREMRFIPISWCGNLTVPGNCPASNFHGGMMCSLLLNPAGATMVLCKLLEQAVVSSRSTANRFSRFKMV